MLTPSPAAGGEDGGAIPASFCSSIIPDGKAFVNRFFAYRSGTTAGAGGWGAFLQNGPVRTPAPTCRLGPIYDMMEKTRKGAGTMLTLLYARAGRDIRGELLERMGASPARRRLLIVPEQDRKSVV